MKLRRKPQHVAMGKGVVLGKRVRLNPFSNLYGCRIGDDCMIGTFVEIQSGVTVGARCRIQSHSFLCTGVTLGDDVFVGHGVQFMNDRHPTAEAARAATWTCEPIRVGAKASIGTGALIMPGVTIGDGAKVGAGALVLKNVRPGSVVAGVPARVLQKSPRP